MLFSLLLERLGELGECRMDEDEEDDEERDDDLTVVIVVDWVVAICCKWGS